MADSRTLDRVYRRFLSICGLNHEHKEALLRRGMTGEEIAWGRYASAPAGRRSAVCRQLMREGFLFNGVPGFYLSDKAWANWLIAGPPGILIPIRDASGAIAGCQIRRHPNPQDDIPKYTWLTSSGRPSGLSSGSPIHVAIPPLQRQEGHAVWLTEGPIKANIAAWRLGFRAVAMPGVGSWMKAFGVCRRMMRRGQRLVVALDMDSEKNPSVFEARSNLCALAYDAGLEPRAAVWNAEYKGVDDALIALEPIRLVRPLAAGIMRSEVQ